MRSIVSSLLVVLAVAVLSACSTQTAVELPAEMQIYMEPVEDPQWAMRTFQDLTRGLDRDQDKFVVLNRAIAARIDHLEEHPGNLSSKELWELGNGWCDNVARLLVNFARAAGYPARLLELTHTDGHNGHVVAEVYYGGKWHLFDPDHGVEYYLPDGSIASFEELSRDQTPVRAIDDPWLGDDGLGMEGFYQNPARFHTR